MKNTRKTISDYIEKKQYVRLIIFATCIIAIILCMILVTVSTAPFIIIKNSYMRHCKKLTAKEAKNEIEKVANTFSPIIHNVLGLKKEAKILFKKFDHTSFSTLGQYSYGKIILEDELITSVIKSIVGSTGTDSKFRDIDVKYTRRNDVILYYESLLRVSKMSKTLFIINSIITLAHELRHSYQYSKDSKVFTNYITGEEDYVMYRRQDVEKDANRFSYKFALISLWTIIKFLFKSKK